MKYSKTHRQIINAYVIVKAQQPQIIQRKKSEVTIAIHPVKEEISFKHWVTQSKEHDIKSIHLRAVY